MSNSSFGKYDFGAEGPHYSVSSRSLRSLININLLLKKEGPQAGSIDHSLLPNTLNKKKHTQKPNKQKNIKPKTKNKQQQLGHGTFII